MTSDLPLGLTFAFACGGLSSLRREVASGDHLAGTMTMAFAALRFLIPDRPFS